MDKTKERVLGFGAVWLTLSLLSGCSHSSTPSVTNMSHAQQMDAFKGDPSNPNRKKVEAAMLKAAPAQGQAYLGKH